MTPAIDTLSEKEKQTLRLILRGHDAKSIARDLDLSVHTVNERLRNVRRKLGVSSSREAARQLLAVEDEAPENLVHKPIGDAPRPPAAETGSQPTRRYGALHPALIAGAVIMLAAIALHALLSSNTTHPHPDPAVAPVSSETVDVARRWLELGDQGRIADAFAATSEGFRTANTLDTFASAANSARTPLGKALGRRAISDEYIPAPPAGYQTVKFRTRFATKEAVETVTLVQENGAWRVTGITID